MVSIEFQFNQIFTVIQAKLEDTFREVIDKYLLKSSVNPESIYFLANGKNITPELTVESQMNKLNKQNNKMKVLVYSIEETTINKEEIKVKSKDIICPKCQEPCRIKIEKENYKIKLFDCSQKHITDNIRIIDFPNTQKINISNVICSKCKTKNKGNSVNNEFYICLTCQQNLCVLCKSFHDKKHNIIEYDNKNYICPKHNELLIKYCKQCFINICFSCDDEHKGHDVISLLDLKPNLTEVNNRLSELKHEIELFNNQIKEIFNKLNELEKAMNTYYEIYKDLISNYKIKNRNYQILQNIKELNDNNEIFKCIKKINSIDNISDKIINIIKLNNKINSGNDKLNQMTIIYKIEKYKDNIKLFGDVFVQNNKNNCYLLIEGQKYALCQYYELNENQRKNKTLEIKLIETKPITDMFRLFECCPNLISIPDIDKWDMKNVTNLRSIFNNTISLKSLPDISKWDTKNVNNMGNMFYNCFELESLPDISKWDTKNVVDMSQMFANCRKLKSLPDISKWELNKKVKKDNMFLGCDQNIIPKNF